jgi:MFS family permease
MPTPTSAAAAGFFMSGAQTGLNAFASSCYPTQARATGVSWMLGMGRFGSIFGSMIGGLLLTMGWGFTPIVMLLAIPASLAALAVLRARRAYVNHPRSAFGAPPQGGAASGPAEPAPRRPLGSARFMCQGCRLGTIQN